MTDWARLHHAYGTAEDVPALTALATTHPPAGYIPALDLAATIIASTDTTEAIRRQYAAELAALQELAEYNLSEAGDETEFVHALQALMSFENGSVWQRHLETIPDGELVLPCPACGENLTLSLEGPDFTTNTTTPITPADPAPPSPEERLLTLTTTHGHPTLTPKLRHLFGRTTCPSCGSPFEIADALA
ncbi:hypothetical protein [Kribbella sp. NPDC051770]|uniref:hypothetical protein n=1 Tax=Kribbella sp. NPDC051770 TaxID=3155413 RepID=UPI003415EDFF